MYRQVCRYRFDTDAERMYEHICVSSTSGDAPPPPLYSFSLSLVFFYIRIITYSSLFLPLSLLLSHLVTPKNYSTFEYATDNLHFF